MSYSLKDIILTYIDDALDIDDLENIGDYVRSVITTEGLEAWQLSSTLKQLYSDLSDSMDRETNLIRKVKIKAAVSYFEANFSDFLIAKEIETLSASSDA